MDIVLNIPEEAWQPVGDPDTEGGEWSRLLACLTINGTHHHLEAIELMFDENGFQQTVSSDMASTFEDYCCASHPDGGYNTTTINGRNYGLFMVPYS